MNRRATLQPWHLEMGGTTKIGVKKQAGIYGEGLKLALLVLQRGQQNHRVLCHSGSFDWNFDFTARGKLVARLERINGTHLTTSDPCVISPDRDVRFVIGLVGAGRNESGLKVQRQHVSLEAFNSWLQAALFLQDIPNDGIIRCEQGDLLTHERLRGNIYLKGFLLNRVMGGNSASITGKPLKFGYNFSTGKTNRDRQSMSTAQEESAAILAI